MSSSISQAHAKKIFGTMHHQDSHQKKHSLTLCLQWKLRNMAKINGGTHQPLLPQLGQDSKRALKRITPRHPINKAKSIGEIHGK
jgi:hypothetical protein